MNLDEQAVKTQNVEVPAAIKRKLLLYQVLRKYASKEYAWYTIAQPNEYQAIPR